MQAAIFKSIVYSLEPLDLGLRFFDLKPNPAEPKTLESTCGSRFESESKCMGMRIGMVIYSNIFSS